MPSDAPRLFFFLREGYLAFAEGELDRWAEHLTWCYRMLGVPDGCIIAVQDFGTSPLSFLGSALLMPTLAAGIVERLGARFVCLDASSERISLTPALLAQLAVDVLVARADIVDLLIQTARRTGMTLDAAPRRVIVATDGSEAVRSESGPWRYLLHCESSLVLAPRCGRCGAFHLREGFYRCDGDLVSNLHRPDLPAAPLPALEAVLAENCDAGPGDQRIRLRVEREVLQ